MGVWRESAATICEAQGYLRRRLASLEPPAEVLGYQNERRLASYSFSNKLEFLLAYCKTNISSCIITRMTRLVLGSLS